MKNKITLTIPVTFTTREGPDGGTYVTATADTPEGLTPADLPDHPAGGGPTKAAALANLRAVIARRVTQPNIGRRVQCDRFGGVWVGPYYRPDTGKWEVSVVVPRHGDSWGETVTTTTDDWHIATEWVEYGRGAASVGAFLRAVGVAIEAVAPANGTATPPITYEELAVRA